MDELNKHEDEFDESIKNIFEEEISDSIENEEQIDGLSKSRSNALIAGVCSGIAKFFNIEPVIIRILFVISIFLGGWGIAGYIITAILLPSGKSSQINFSNNLFSNNYEKTIIGGFLVFIGLFFIADGYDFLSYFLFIDISKFLFIPLVLIVAGIFVLIKRKLFEKNSSPVRQSKIYKSMSDKRFFGVCGGLASYLNVESNSLRIVWLLLTFLTAGVGIIIYFLFVLILSKEKLVLENIERI